MEWNDYILPFITGVALAAACGLRVFLPLLVAGVAAYFGEVQFSDGFEWVGTPPAVIIFAVATLAEIIAYYIPWLDNGLDVIASPAAVVAGISVSAAFAVEFDPAIQWSLAIIAGGGAAGTVQAVSVGTRAASTATTGGLGNPVLSTLEWVGAALLSILAVVAIPLAFLLLIVLLFVLWRRRRRVRRNMSAPVPAP